MQRQNVLDERSFVNYYLRHDLITLRSFENAVSSQAATVVGVRISLFLQTTPKMLSCLLSCLFQMKHALSLIVTQSLTTRGGVEDTRLEAEAMDTEKIRGLGQGQRFQGQTLSRPRTEMLEAKAKDTAASVLQKKKKGLQKSFSGNLQFKGVARIFN